MGIQVSTQGQSSGILKLLDPSRKTDYFFALLIGGAPIAAALAIGAATDLTAICGDTSQLYRGYLSFANWWSLMFLLPIVLFAFRWLTQKMMPVQKPEPDNNLPPILRLVGDQSALPRAYNSLRHDVLKRSNLWIAVLIATAINVLDIWPVLSPYLSDGTASVSNWTSLALASGSGCTLQNDIGVPANLALIALAYLAQYVVTIVGILAIILIFRHNLFFLRNVYQRRREVQRPAAEMFHIDVRDVNRCFGFRAATGAFNTQVLGLIIAGFCMLLSRYANTDSSGDSAIRWFSWPPVLPEFQFTVAGQWAMALAWLVALFIVAMPSIVKLLPRLPVKGAAKTQHSIKYYLQEFFSEQNWPTDYQGNQESIELVSARFARNSFWPTGDNRARILFFFSYWVFFAILIPPSYQDYTTLIVTLAVFGVFAYLLTLATFAALRLMVGFVDHILIDQQESTRILQKYQAVTPAANQEKTDLGVFISYRRADTIEYARSIHKELSGHFREDRLFRDLSDIEPGENFVDAIDRALEQVEAVLILIGADWISIEDEQGRKRLHKPNDMVAAEVRRALQSNKRVIPVLLENAMMPGEAELPEDLKPLAFLNALEISDSRWEYDTGRLIDTLKKIKTRTRQELVT